MSNTRSTTSSDLAVHHAPVQTTAFVVGIAFLLVGVLGFVPGITTGYDSLGWAGPDSTAMLFGVFQVSILHNLVHLAFGVLGVLMSRRASAAKAYLLAGGVVYLVLWVYGIVVAESSQANFVPLNTADDWLHLGLGLGMVALGLVMPRRYTRETAPSGHGSTAGGDIQ
ncbi:DUF4383 domain-containing protein [Kineococcus sp. LSe6-4]|uniref:DUF4383 domain-containing protein n=1 Tax=Kineococcus halophytocola TaxID=3234027 RepID=A0ABV4H5H7_9ACTN